MKDYNIITQQSGAIYVIGDPNCLAKLLKQYPIVVLSLLGGFATASAEPLTVVVVRSTTPPPKLDRMTVLFDSRWTVRSGRVLPGNAVPAWMAKVNGTSDVAVLAATNLLVVVPDQELASIMEQLTAIYNG